MMSFNRRHLERAGVESVSEVWCRFFNAPSSLLLQIFDTLWHSFKAFSFVTFDEKGPLSWEAASISKDIS